MLPNEYKPRPVRPMSEIINPGRFMNEGNYTHAHTRTYTQKRTSAQAKSFFS